MTDFIKETNQNLITSISYSQTEIIKNILKLYTDNNVIDCDPTYSKGVFYKNSGIKTPRYRYDINPVIKGVVKCDCRHLPLDDSSIGCLIFDPPFLATTGKSLLTNDKNNIINKRFGVYPSEFELHQFYIDSLKESYRVLKNNGIMIFKCQDKVSSGKQYMSHCFIIEEAVKQGFYVEDFFILLAKNRIVADWQVKNQKHSRKFHSYFIVLRKCNKSVRYIQDDKDSQNSLFVKEQK